MEAAVWKESPSERGDQQGSGRCRWRGDRTGAGTHQAAPGPGWIRAAPGPSRAAQRQLRQFPCLPRSKGPPARSLKGGLSGPRNGEWIRNRGHRANRTRGIAMNVARLVLTESLFSVRTLSGDLFSSAGTGRLIVNRLNRNFHRILRRGNLGHHLLHAFRDLVVERAARDQFHRPFEFVPPSEASS